MNRARRPCRLLCAAIRLLPTAILVGPLLVTARAEEPEPAALQARVDRAIDAGVSWLRAQQREDGSFPLAPWAERGFGDPSGQWAGGPWNKGVCALSVYALAVCDAMPDEPSLARGFENLQRLWRTRAPPTAEGSSVRPGDGISTYFVSLCLLALDAAWNRAAAPLGAGPPDPRLSGSRRIGKANYAWARELTAWLEEAQDPGNGRAPRGAPGPDDGGGFGYESPFHEGEHHDHSNTQFAVLGLKAASRLGVKVRDETFLRALRHLLLSQETDGPEVDRVPASDAGDDRARRAPGESRTTDEAPRKDRARGWSYMCPVEAARTMVPGAPPGDLPGLPFPPGAAGPGPGPWPPGGIEVIVDPPSPSMTAGGVSTLVVCRSELHRAGGLTPELRRLTVQGIRDGLAWLAHEPLFGTLDDFYFLYGLERACILGGVATVGGVDWYAMGAERILQRQREDGSFLSESGNNGNGRAEIDTCFALLFLKRAIFRVPPSAAVTPDTGR